MPLVQIKLSEEVLEGLKRFSIKVRLEIPKNAKLVSPNHLQSKQAF